MNISMSAVQDSLARQSSALSDAQRDTVRTHAQGSADILKLVGVDDPTWLCAVRDHHTIGESVDDDAQPGARIAELLRRIDIYTAKLSRRAGRAPSSPALAARDACLGPAGHPDSIGATLLRVLGLYPPGTWVNLANGEQGVVIRRGEKAHTPVVAAVRRNDGGLLLQPVRRDTSVRTYRVRHGLNVRDVRVRINAARVLGA